MGSAATIVAFRSGDARAGPIAHLCEVRHDHPPRRASASGPVEMGRLGVKPIESWPDIPWSEDPVLALVREEIERVRLAGGVAAVKVVRPPAPHGARVVAYRGCVLVAWGGGEYEVAYESTERREVEPSAAQAGPAE